MGRGGPYRSRKLSEALTLSRAKVLAALATAGRAVTRQELRAVTGLPLESDGILVPLKRLGWIDIEGKRLGPGRFQHAYRYSVTPRGLSVIGLSEGRA